MGSASPDLETLGKIAALAAHDLNNNLQAILSSIELAIATPELAPGLLEHAASSIATAQELTSRMLVLAKPDDTFRSVVDPAAGLRMDERFIRAMLPRHVELELDLPPTRLCVRAATRRLQRSIQNLLLNAAAAIDPEGGRITIRVAAATNGSIEITVQDNGRGMDADTLARISEPGHTTREDGHGLGLLSVRECVLADGGELRIESSPGGGTSATLCYPAVQAAPTSRPMPEVGRAFHGSSGSRRLLVVEDEPFVRQALAITMGRMGYMPFAASSTAGAIELLGTVGGFAAIFLDLSLPDSVNGASAIEALRTAAPSVPIVAMSGSDPYKVLDDLRGEPPAGFLAKPFTAATLRSLLECLAPPS